MLQPYLSLGTTAQSWGPHPRTDFISLLCWGCLSQFSRLPDFT